VTIADAIVEKVRSMPIDKQQAILAYVEEMERQSSPPRGAPLFNPEGIAAGLMSDLTLEEFQVVRREMWGSS